MEYKINIETSDQSLALNRIASKYPFEIWVHGVSGQADAKSMLGLMLLTLESDLKIVVPDAADVSEFEQEINEFLVKEE